MMSEARSRAGLADEPAGVTTLVTGDRPSSRLGWQPIDYDRSRGASDAGWLGRVVADVQTLGSNERRHPPLAESG
jgi:hypothetical protein